MREQGDALFWIWLSQCFGAGSKLYPALLERFGTPYDIFKAEDEEIASVMPELTPRERAALVSCVPDTSWMMETALSKFMRFR